MSLATRRILSSILPQTAISFRCRRSLLPVSVVLSSSLFPRMDASVNEEFVHVTQPEIYSVYEEGGGDTSPDREQSLEGSIGPEVAVVHEVRVAGDGDRDGGGGIVEERYRGELPEELSKSVMRLECESVEGGICDVYLVGTAHVSKESCREVQDVIGFLKPQVVFLELCPSRVAILSPPETFKVPTAREMIDSWKKKDSNALGVLYGWFLAKVASTLDVLPGSEFRVAFEEANICGARVVLGDRPVKITLQRTWGKMSLWHKIKFLYSMLFQAMFLPSAEDLQRMLKDIEDADVVTLLIQEMSKEFPTIMETLVYERDMYMSSNLLKIATNHSSVVAVVGKGHLSGIKKHWKKPIKLEHILEIPASSGLSAMKMLASLTVVVTGAAIISGIYIFGRR